MYRKINFWGLPTRIVQICKRSANFDEPRATTFAKYFPLLDIGFRKDWVGGHVYKGVQNWPKVWMWSLPQTVVVHGIKLLVQFPPQTWNLSRPALVNFFFFKLCWFFKKTAGFLAKFLEIWNLLFYLVSLHTTFLQKVYWNFTLSFQFQQKGTKIIYIEIYAVLLIAYIVTIYAILVSEIFGPKIQSCKIFDKFHVCFPNVKM